MKGNATIIKDLNQVLQNELTAINQYFLHARMFKNWGYSKLNDKEYAGSIDEMKHADQIVERILFLEGLPNLQDLGKIYVGESPVEALKCDLKLETEAVDLLRQAIGRAETEQDYATRSLLREILTSEEEHVDWLETQLDLIDKLGEKHYLLSQI